MDAIDLGCRSFVTRLLFAALAIIGLLSMLREWFPDVPYWLSVLAILACDVSIAAAYKKRGEASRYLAHVWELLLPGGIGIFAAYLLWGFTIGVDMLRAIIIAAITAAIALFARCWIARETSLVTGLNIDGTSER